MRPDVQRANLDAAIKLADKARIRLYGLPGWLVWVARAFYGVDIQETRSDCWFASYYLRKVRVANKPKEE